VQNAKHRRWRWKLGMESGKSTSCHLPPLESDLTNARVLLQPICLLCTHCMFSPHLCHLKHLFNSPSVRIFQLVLALYHGWHQIILAAEVALHKQTWLLPCHKSRPMVLHRNGISRVVRTMGAGLTANETCSTLPNPDAYKALSLRILWW
jgi:hypothetical protein